MGVMLYAGPCCMYVLCTVLRMEKDVIDLCFDKERATLVVKGAKYMYSLNKQVFSECVL